MTLGSVPFPDYDPWRPTVTQPPLTWSASSMLTFTQRQTCSSWRDAMHHAYWLRVGGKTQSKPIVYKQPYSDPPGWVVAWVPRMIMINGGAL